MRIDGLTACIDLIWAYAQVFTVRGLSVAKDGIPTVDETTKAIVRFD